MLLVGEHPWAEGDADGGIAMKTKRALTGSFFSIVSGAASIHAASAIQIDIRNYIEGVPASIAICSSGDPSQRVCISQYLNVNNEWTLTYTLGTPTDSYNPKIIDYMARSGYPPNYYGVIRNFDRSTGPTLFRCLGLVNPDRVCQAPPNPQFFPENVPVIFDANQVNATTVLATENSSSGAPETTIPGTTFVTGNSFRSLAVNSMDPSSCAQQIGNEIGIRVSLIYVIQYPFGGDIGNRDSLIIDEEESASSGGIIAPNPTHLEWYYYVSGYGRVKEGSSNYNSNTGRYDIFNTGASLRNVVVNPNPIPTSAVICPQGSAPMPR